MDNAQRTRVIEAVFRAVDQVNSSRDQAKRLARLLDASLTGPGAVLDSLGLVNFVVAVEEQIEDEFGVAVAVADQRSRTQARNPLQSIGALVDDIVAQLGASAKR